MPPPLLRSSLLPQPLLPCLAQPQGNFSRGKPHSWALKVPAHPLKRRGGWCFGALCMSIPKFGRAPLNLDAEPQNEHLALAWGAEQRIPPSAASPVLTQPRQIGHCKVITMCPTQASLPTSSHSLWKIPAPRTQLNEGDAPSTPKLPPCPEPGAPAAPTPRGTQPRVTPRGGTRVAVPAWRHCPARRGQRGSSPTFGSGCLSQGKRWERAQPSRGFAPAPRGGEKGPAAAPRHRRGQRQDVLSLPCTSQRALYITSAA